MTQLKIRSASIVSATLLAASLFLSSCAAPSAPASRQITQYVMKPQVTIRNNSRQEILLGLRGPETRYITIPARASGTIAIHSGTYKYAAKAHNTPVISGYKTFGTDARYTWDFGVH